MTYNVYLNVSYDDNVPVGEASDDTESKIVEVLTQYILIEYDCILNISLDKTKEDIINDATFKEGYYLTKNYKIYKKEKFTDVGWVWNSDDYKAKKLGNIMLIKVKSDEVAKKEAEEDGNFLKKVSSYIKIIHEQKDIKERCIALDTFFSFVIRNKEILNRGYKFNDIKQRLKNMLVGIETDVADRKMLNIFNPTNYYNELFN